MRVDPLRVYQCDVLIRSYYKCVKFKPFRSRTKNITISTLLNNPLQNYYRRLASLATSEEQVRLWLSVAYFMPNIKSIPDVMANLTKIQEIAMLLEAPEYHINKDLRFLDEEKHPLFYALTNMIINPITFCLCVGWLNLKANPQDFFKNGMIQKAHRFLVINEFAMVSDEKIFLTKSMIWDILKVTFKEEPDNYMELTVDVDEEE